MKKINFFSTNVKFQNKTILLRLDYNVPILNNEISDATRINITFSFLNLLIENKCKIVIISHLGRPKGKKEKNLSLKPVYNYLAKTFGKNITFYPGEVNETLKKNISKMEHGKILLLENIRFFKEEIENNKSFAKKLARLGDIYVNDAFSCSHRKQASIHAITEFIDDSFAGPLIKKELNAIDLILKNKKKPISCIIGGSKISTKINILKNLIKETQNIFVVGAMANNFLKFNGKKIGKSLIEKNVNSLIEEIYSNAAKFNCKIITPIDCLVSENLNGKAKIKNLDNILDDEIILDIGPKSTKKLCDEINLSKTILWNGPAGYFENINFAKGTNEIANKISENTIKGKLTSVVGGGDTLSALNKFSADFNFTHLSTAGGAFLEYLEGKDLPGLTVLK